MTIVVRAGVIHRHPVSLFFFCLCIVINRVLSQSNDRPAAAAAAAGLKMRTNESAFDGLLKSLARSAFKGVDMQKSMPDESGSKSLSFLGNVDYKITNIQARDFKQPEFKTTIRPDKVNVSLTGTGFTVVAKWTYKHRWFGVSDSGSVNASVSVSSVNVSLAFGYDPRAGRPTVAVAGCSVTVSNVAVRLSGGASWFYNLFFTGAFAKSSVEGKVQANVCAHVRRSVDVEAAAAIAAQPLQWDLGEGLAIDLRLSQPPFFGEGYVECLHNGTVYDRNNPVKAPIQPGPFPPIDDSTQLKSFSVWSSEYVLGSCAHALYSRGTMRTTVTPSTLPPSMGWFLNTTCPGDASYCVGKLFPQIGAKYPNCVLEIELAVVGPPMVGVRPTGVLVVITVSVLVRARCADGSVSTVCNVVLTTNTSVMVYMKDSETKVEVSRIQPNVTSVANSTVGTIDSSELSGTLEYLARQYLQMEKVEKVFPSPDLKVFRFEDEKLYLLYGSLLLTGDLGMSS